MSRPRRGTRALPTRLCICVTITVGHIRSFWRCKVLYRTVMRELLEVIGTKNAMSTSNERIEVWMSMTSRKKGDEWLLLILNSSRAPGNNKHHRLRFLPIEVIPASLRNRISWQSSSSGQGVSTRTGDQFLNVTDSTWSKFPSRLDSARFGRIRRRLCVSTYVPFSANTHSLRPPMARTKQATPLRKEPSDFESTSHSVKHANGNTSKVSAITSNGKPKAPFSSATQEQVGLPQLLVCVGGIYISL